MANFSLPRPQTPRGDRIENGSSRRALWILGVILGILLQKPIVGINDLVVTYVDSELAIPADLTDMIVFAVWIVVGVTLASPLYGQGRIRQGKRWILSRAMAILQSLLCLAAVVVGVGLQIRTLWWLADVRKIALLGTGSALLATLGALAFADSLQQLIDVQTLRACNECGQERYLAGKRGTPKCSVRHCSGQMVLRPTP